jgi:hypothetical protein
MSTPEARQSHGTEVKPSADAVDNVVHAMPIVLPVVGGLLMFLLAFIAVYLA